VKREREEDEGCTESDTGKMKRRGNVSKRCVSRRTKPPLYIGRGSKNPLPLHN